MMKVGVSLVMMRIQLLYRAQQIISGKYFVCVVKKVKFSSYTYYTFLAMLEYF